ncbi:MAG: hypothetical protein K2W82_04230 [Candidatus Obscuribacterales bacterium]|nr:hypothetical protein [Candidatus Obscuribacterales bacterium]
MRFAKNLFVFGFALLTFFCSSKAEEEPGWECYQKSRLAQVCVEKKLYKTGKGDRFFVQVCITNHNDQPIGIKGGEHSEGRYFYPRSWTVVADPKDPNAAINGIRIEPPKADKQRDKMLLADFKDGKLQMIAPHKSFIYYTDFNNNTLKDVAKECAGTGFMQVIMESYCFATDGKKCEIVFPMTIIPIKLPTSVYSIPAHSKLLTSGGY